MIPRSSLPMNRKLILYSYPANASAMSDATTQRPDAYTLAQLTTQKTLFGHITDIAPDENFDSQMTVQPRMILIQCRWFSALDTKWLLYFNSKMYEIISARELGTQQYWEIKAKMSIGQPTLEDGGELP